MTKIFYVEHCRQGEIEGFFDGDGNCLHAWSLNDASWRSEYMDPLLEALGIVVDYSKSDDVPLQKKLCEQCGEDYEDEDQFGLEGEEED